MLCFTLFMKPWYFTILVTGLAVMAVLSLSVSCANGGGSRPLVMQPGSGSGVEQIDDRVGHSSPDADDDNLAVIVDNPPGDEPPQLDQGDAATPSVDPGLKWTPSFQVHPIPANPKALDLSPMGHDFSPTVPDEVQYLPQTSGSSYVTVNYANEFQNDFDSSGEVSFFQSTQRGGGELFTIRLDSYGRSVQSLPAVTQHKTEGDKITYVRGAVMSEWYINSRAGLEQGVLLNTTPAGTGELVFHYDVSGAKVWKDRGIVFIRPEDEKRLLTWKDLRVTDSEGSVLASRLEADNSSRLSIYIDDSSAVYPITIDPFFANYVIYVDESKAAGGQTGEDWTNAFVTLTSAIQYATESCEIWMAEGEYFTEHATVNANWAPISTFLISTDFSIYGGFESFFESTTKDYRNWETFATTLSGVLLTSNSNHVITMDADATLDGLVITGGNAIFKQPGVPYVSTNRYGGGIFARDTSPTIRNCRFVDNIGVFGGSIAFWGPSSPTVENCVFEYTEDFNLAKLEDYSDLGGAVYIYNSNPSFTRCVFENHISNLNGGGIYARISEVEIDTSLFQMNSGLAYVHADPGASQTDGGGAVYLDNTSASFNNTMFLSNQVFTNESTSASSGNNWTTSASRGGAVYAYYSDVILYNTVFYNNYSREGGGIYVYRGSADAENSLFFLNRSTPTYNGVGGAVADWNSQTSWRHCVFTENGAYYGGGVYYGNTNGSDSDFNSSIFYNNRSYVDYTFPPGPDTLHGEQEFFLTAGTPPDFIKCNINFDRCGTDAATSEYRGTFDPNEVDILRNYDQDCVNSDPLMLMNVYDEMNAFPTQVTIQTTGLNFVELDNIDALYLSTDDGVLFLFGDDGMLFTRDDGLSLWPSSLSIDKGDINLGEALDIKGENRPYEFLPDISAYEYTTTYMVAYSFSDSDFTPISYYAMYPDTIVGAPAGVAGPAGFGMAMSFAAGESIRVSTLTDKFFPHYQGSLEFKLRRTDNIYNANFSLLDIGDGVSSNMYIKMDADDTYRLYVQQDGTVIDREFPSFNLTAGDWNDIKIVWTTMSSGFFIYYNINDTILQSTIISQLELSTQHFFFQPEGDMDEIILQAMPAYFSKGYYSFDSGGEPYDEWGFNLGVTSGTVAAVSGHHNVGLALDLTDPDAQLRVPLLRFENFPQVEGFVHFWVKPDPVSDTSQILFDEPDATRDHFYMRSNGSGAGNYEFGIQTDSGRNDTYDFSLNLEQWNHLAYVWSTTSDSIEFYLNGELEYTTPLDGFSPNGQESFMNPYAVIDEMVIMNEAPTTPSGVINAMVTLVPTTGYYPLDSDGTDTSGYDNYAQITGSTSSETAHHNTGQALLLTTGTEMLVPFLRYQGFSTDNGTLDLWYKPEGVSDDSAHVIDEPDTDRDHFFLQSDGEGDRFRFVMNSSVSGTLAEDVVYLPSGRWHHLAVTWGEGEGASSGGGYALDLDGTDAYAMVPDMMDFSTDYSISFWINPSSPITTQQFLFYKDGVFNIRIMADSSIRLFLGGIGGYVSSAKVNEGEYNHVVITVSEDFPATEVYRKFYINGVLVDDNTFNFGPVLGADAGTSIYVASQVSFNSTYKGTMDEVRFFSEAIPLADVQTLYNGGTIYEGATGSDNVAEAIYHFNEGAGTTIVDSSDGGYDGTLYGSATFTAAKLFSFFVNGESRFSTAMGTWTPHEQTLRFTPKGALDNLRIRDFIVSQEDLRRDISETVTTASGMISFDDGVGSDDYDHQNDPWMIDGPPVSVTGYDESTLAIDLTTTGFVMPYNQYDNFSTQAGSIFFRYYPSASWRDEANLLDEEDPNRSHFAIVEASSAGKYDFFWQDAGDVTRYGNTTFSVVTTTWHSVALTWSVDDDEIRLYSDGTLLLSSSMGAWLPDEQLLKATPNAWVDEFYVLDYALSDGFLTKVSTSRAAIPAWFSFDADSTVDDSGNQNFFEVVGAESYQVGAMAQGRSLDLSSGEGYSIPAMSWVDLPRDRGKLSFWYLPDVDVTQGSVLFDSTDPARSHFSIVKSTDKTNWTIALEHPANPEPVLEYPFEMYPGAWNHFVLIWEENGSDQDFTLTLNGNTHGSFTATDWRAYDQLLYGTPDGRLDEFIIASSTWTHDEELTYLTGNVLYTAEITFDDNTADDQGGSENHVYYSNGANFYSGGLDGTLGMIFSGASDNLYFPLIHDNIFPQDEGSVTFWFLPVSTAGGGQLLDQSDFSRSHFVIGTTGGGGYYFAAEDALTGDYIGEKTVFLRETQWNYLGITWSSSLGEINFYLNGFNVYSTDMGDWRPNAQRLVMYPNGALDSIKLSSRAFTAYEVYEEYRDIYGVGETYSLVAWGQGSEAQLGDGSLANRSQPTPIATAVRLTTLGVGPFNTYANFDDANFYGWGLNDFGQLGKFNGAPGSERLMSPSEHSDIFSPLLFDAGRTHGAAYLLTGEVWAWGDNTYGQLGDGTLVSSTDAVTVVGVGSVKDLKCGDYHTLALLEDGTVMAWGRNNYGQLGDGSTADNPNPFVVPGLANIVEIAAGANHSLAVASDGSVYAWGDNSWGQCADATMSYLSSPQFIAAISDGYKVAAGFRHSLVISTPAGIYAFGSNLYGQLANQVVTSSSSTPTLIDDTAYAEDVACGYRHSLMLTSSAGVYAWGENSSGQLGNGSGVNSSTPVKSLLTTTAVGIEAAGYHSFAIISTTDYISTYTDNWAYFPLDDGTPDDQSGNERDGEFIGEPSLLGEADSVGGLAMEFESGEGMYSDWLNGDLFPASKGTVRFWVYPDPAAPNGNALWLDSNNAADATREHIFIEPSTDANGEYKFGINVVGTGVSYTTFALNSGAWNHVAFTWSQGNTVFLIVNNEELDPISPAGAWMPSDQIFSVTPYGRLDEVEVLPRQTTTNLLLELTTGINDGSIGTSMLGWGANSLGQLNQQNYANQDEVVYVLSMTNALDIAAGGRHGLALLFDGTIWAWGYNNNGQLGDGTVGTDIKRNRMVQGLSSEAVAVAAGENHSLALLDDGSVVAWGLNASGQLGDNRQSVKASMPVSVLMPSDVGVSTLSCSYQGSFAITTDGGLYVWGANSSGQLGTGTVADVLSPVGLSLSSSPVKVVGGVSHTMAMCEDGSVRTWGSNDYGQLGDGTLVQRSSPVTPIVGKGQLETGLELWLKMNDLAAPAADSSGNGRDAAATGAVTAGLAGKFDNAFDFADPAYVQTADFGAADSYENLTLSFWYNTAATGTLLQWGNEENTQIIRVGVDTGGGASLVLRLRNDSDATAPETIWQATDAGYADGNWHHVALVLQSTSYNLYFDGALQRYGTEMGKGSFIPANGITIGANHDGSNGMTGKVDDVRIFARALHQREIIGLTTPLTAVDVAAGAYQSYALVEYLDGTRDLMTWGDNTYLQLGRNTVMSYDRYSGTADLSALPLLQSVSSVHAGANHVLLVLDNGEIWGWGRNNSGQLGDQSTTDRSSPVQTVIDPGLLKLDISRGDFNLLLR